MLAAMPDDSYSPNFSNSISVFDPASPSAQQINSLFWLIIWISLVIFSLVVGTMIYYLIRFHRRNNQDDSEPPQIYGSRRLELAWTIAPFLTVFVIFLVVIRIVAQTRSTHFPPNDLLVTVVGHQWWWDFGYPEYHFHTANEMHVPFGPLDDLHTVYLDLESADVVHAFWVPRLAGKTALIPGRVNHTFFAALEPGLYRGQCAAYCGAEHAKMLIRVYAESPEKFHAWVRHQQQPAVSDPAVAPGRNLFLSMPCYNCHTIRGTPAHGTVGPDLTHLMSRRTLAAGVIPNDRSHLRAWVENPQAIKRDCHMPQIRMSPEQLDQIVDYLSTLK